MSRAKKQAAPPNLDPSFASNQWIAKRFLWHWTDAADGYWMHRIERLIGKHIRPAKKGETLGSMDEMSNWLADIAEEVYARVATKKTGDHNIVSACVLGLVLSLWASRLTRAKCCDPRRKKEHRKLMADWLGAWHHALLGTMIDESRDSAYFTNPQWTLPYAPEPVAAKVASRKKRKTVTLTKRK